MIRVGIDLGCDHIRLVTYEEGLVFDEPCLIAFDDKGHVLAIGNDAKQLQDTMDDTIQFVQPLSTTQIDFDALHALIDQLCYDYHVFKLFKKTILLFSYPTNLTSSQCHELKKHLLDFGAQRVYFKEEIWIAAIGAKLDLFLPVASCVLNIGSSNCDIATFYNGTIQSKSQCKISGRQVNQLIAKWLKQTYFLQVSQDTLEMIKCGLGQTIHQENPKTMTVRGIDLKTQERKTIEINENQLVDLLYPLVEQWTLWILHFLESLESEEREDILSRGIIACGGTMLLKGFEQNLKKLLPCPIYTTDDPLNTVSQGLEILLSRMD